MRQLLVINPNTSAGVSNLLQQHAGGGGLACGGATATARWAPRTSPVRPATRWRRMRRWMPGHTTWCNPHPQPEAILIGRFGDPGLDGAAREQPRARHGLGRGPFRASCPPWVGFAIVTGGERWGPLQRLAQALGHAHALAGIHTGAHRRSILAADPDAARTLLAQACRDRCK